MVDKKSGEEVIIPTINMNIINYKGKPALEMRKVITDLEAIKLIIDTAFSDQPLVIVPIINNKPLAINRLIEVGLVNIEEGEYKYLF